MRRLSLALWITLVWIALWGDLSWANVLGGAAVAVVLLTAVPLPVQPPPRRIRPLPALVFFGIFLRDLVVATAEVARQVLWPVDRLRPAVLAVQLAGRQDPGLVALVANTISLTPGTLTIEADSDRGLLWVHVLHLGEGEEESVVEHARALERLGARVLGTDLGTTAAGPTPGGSA